MKSSLEYTLYKYSPVFIQNLICTVYGYNEKKIRFGEKFDYWFEKLQEMDNYSEIEIEAYQNEQLQSLIKLSYHNVPFYKRVFAEQKLQPSDIKTKDDLYKIPVTTKEDIRKYQKEFINPSYSKKDLIVKKTSGTTGKSLTFYSTKEAISFQWAVWWRHRLRFGFHLGDKHLNFTGKPIVPISQHKPPYWRWNKAHNQALLGMQTIQKGHIHKIAEFINKNNFKFWIGYPSIINSFCSLLSECDIELYSKPDIIFLGAENIYNDQKQNIEQITNAIITDQYGFTEGAGNASHCNYLNHHTDFEFGIMECVEPEKLEEGELQGKIVCTGFSNKAFPFIRYEVGDTGVWADNAYDCPCRRHSSILKRIEGRIEDYVITPEGRKIMRFDYIFKDTHQIQEAQVVQNKPGEIEINLVTRDDYKMKTEGHLKEMVKKYISPELSVKFCYKNKIPREQNGKFRAVKSNLNQ